MRGIEGYFPALLYIRFTPEWRWSQKMPAIPPIPRKYPAALGEMTMKNTESLAACGSPNCGGCYEVGGGFKIHPPKPNQAQGVCGRPDCVGCFTVEDVTFHQKKYQWVPDGFKSLRGRCENGDCCGVRVVGSRFCDLHGLTSERCGVGGARA